MRPRAELVRLFDFEPDLLAHVPAPDRDAATERLIVETRTFAAGLLNLETAQEGEGAVDLLILEGMLVHRLECFGRHSVEILGPGDILRPNTPPWLRAAARSSWRAAGSVRVASLGRRFRRDLVRWPGVSDELLDRLASRSTTLAVQLAIAQMPSLEGRLLSILWSLAQRWGRVDPEGVSLRLPVSQEVLAALVGARRSSVSSAMCRLRASGSLVQVTAGHWRLVAGCPPELAAIDDSMAVT